MEPIQAATDESSHDESPDGLGLKGINYDTCKYFYLGKGLLPRREAVCSQASPLYCNPPLTVTC